MGTYEGSATLIGADGTVHAVRHASIRTRTDRTRAGVSAWQGRLDLGEVDVARLAATEAILRLPDGSEATIAIRAGGTFTGTAEASTP